MKEEQINIIKKIIGKFLIEGPKNLTTDEISSYLGISKKTLYQHFSNKECLICNVVDYLSDQITENIDQIQKQNYPPIEELFIIHETVFKLINSDNNIFMKQLNKYYSEIHENHCSNETVKMMEFFKANYKKGIESKVYKDQTNIELIFSFFFALIRSTNTNKLFDNFNYNNQKIHFEILKYHIQAIVTPKGEKIFFNILNTKYNNQID